MMIKNLKLKTKTSLLAGVILTIVSCQQYGVLHEIDRDAIQSNAYIEFGNYVSSMTRASKTSGYGGFSVGDTMAVWGIQTTDSIVDVIFNNQDVRYIEDATWTYDQKKLWNKGSTYMFYGVFPYSTTLYTMSNDSNRYVTIPVFTTPDATEQQTDLMISERRDVSPFYTVDMYFHHILSNVNIYAKISNDLDTAGISSVTIKSIRFYNVKATGHYEQTGWDHNRAVGSWTDIRDYMQIPDKAEIEITKTSTAIYHDYLMMPQILFSVDSKPKDVCIDATFRIIYKDGTSATYIKNGIRLAGITGISNATRKAITSWEPNYKYNYTLTFNPLIATRTWDADGDGGLKIDPETGDTITSVDDTPFPGIMKYNPDEPDKIYIFEDTDQDGKPDTWNTYPLAWEDVDGDGQLEAGVDSDDDGHIDNLDGDNDTQMIPGGDPDKKPSDGNSNNPDGKDVILVHIDSDGDGDIDNDDDWVQIQKDPDTGIITPVSEIEDACIHFTATVQEWEQKYTLNYN